MGCLCPETAQFGIGHHRGASGGQTRRFSAVSQRDLRHTPLGLQALELWRSLEQESARSLLTLTGGLLIGAPDEPLVGAAAESLRLNGLEHEVIDASALRTRGFCRSKLGPTVLTWSR
jgi:sarcosine oxidase